MPNPPQGYKDPEITAARMVELDAANIPADIDVIKADASYLADASLPASPTAGSLARFLASGGTALGTQLPASKSLYDVIALDRWDVRLSAARAAYLDNINQAGLLQVTAARAALLDQITALRLAELDAANVPADVDTLKAAIGAIEGATALHNKLTAARAAFLDVAISSRLAAASYTAERGTDNAALAATALSTAQWTNALATALGSYTAALATILGNFTAARIGYLDNINQAGLLQVTAARAGYLDKLPNFEHEVEWASTPVSQQVASAALTDLTAGSITPTFPTGATRVRVLLLASIGAANQAANTHHIGFTVQGQKGALGYVTQLTLTAVPPLGLVNLDGAGDSWAGAIDVTALVDASGSTYTFRFQVDSDNAGAVNYTTGFVLLLVYRI